MTHLDDTIIGYYGRPLLVQQKTYVTIYCLKKTSNWERHKIHHNLRLVSLKQKLNRDKYEYERQNLLSDNNFDWKFY